MIRSATRAWRLLSVGCALAGAVAIVSTYRVFSQTFDEPAHLASGMEWLSKGTYHYEAQHPPLERVLEALGPYLSGDRSVGKIDQFYEGQLILGAGEHYRRSLALARLGVLPFFIAVCAIVWLWGRRLMGEAGGALSVLFVAANPNILAHAGLATTDMAPATMVAAVLLAYSVWIERPDRRATIILGLAVGLAVVSKFSAIAFLGVAWIGVEAWRAVAARRWRTPGGLAAKQLASRVGLAALVAMLVIWATYRFSFGPVNPGSRVPVPAPELFRGLAIFLSHGTSGHPSFLLGEISNTGWWYYFPVAIAVKTPLPLLLLFAVGTMEVVRRMRERDVRSGIPLIGIAAVIVIGMTTKVNIGIRHVLPLYPMMAIVAAEGALALWRQTQAARLVRPLTVALVASVAFVAVRARPDFLAYFNPIAGDHPERILVDSNLDWGQDLYRLAEVATRLHGDSVRVAYFGSANIAAVGVPNARALGVHERATGWVAASQTFLAGVWVDNAYAWLLQYPPVGRIGPSMLLFRVPPHGTALDGPRDGCAADECDADVRSVRRMDYEYELTPPFNHAHRGDRPAARPELAHRSAH